jgi:uncharacterized protein (TIGR03000 family)
VYSIVLMAALTTGGEAPELFFHGHGCHGCCGGWGCHGCHGCWGCHGCHGCYGCCGCYGGCCGGCYGGGWGCYGGYGCWGCWGGYSAWSYGCYSNGCCGGYGGYGGGYGYGGYTGGVVAPGGGMAPGYPDGGTAPGGEPLPKPKPDDKNKGTSAAPNRAKLIVELPADAKLYVDDRAMKSTSGVRTFNTPELEPGQLYYYELRVEVERDGKPVTETKRVIVKAGEVVRANFPKVESESVAAKTR